MKVIINKAEVAFDPVTIEITIESPSELCDLWQRTNCRSTVIENSASVLMQADWGSSRNLFLALDVIAKAKGLKLLEH